MVKIPKRNSTKSIINQRQFRNRPSRRLGMSAIGTECLRILWYSFHWASPQINNARSKRIFRIGDLFEEMIIKDLTDVGVKCYRVENKQHIPITGKVGETQEEVMGFHGHSIGKIDGRALGLVEYPNTEVLLEFKTMAEKYFKGVYENGVQRSQPKYYAQAQRYMHGLDLKICLFIAINKNDCSYYFEYIYYDKNYALDLCRKEQTIIMSDAPLDRAYSFGHYKCGFCSHNKICHLGEQPERNCRTCDFSDIDSGGKWLCTNLQHHKDIGHRQKDYELDFDEQINGCDHWKIGWGLDS